MNLFQALKCKKIKHNRVGSNLVKHEMGDDMCKIEGQIAESVRLPTVYHSVGHKFKSAKLLC